MSVLLELLACPHGMRAVAIGPDSDRSVRVTSGKHCGRWEQVASWYIDGEETIRVIEDAMEDSQK